MEKVALWFSNSKRGPGSHKLEMVGVRGTYPRVEAEDFRPLGRKGHWEGARTLGWGGH